MLFNSIQFIFAFLPVTIAGFFVLGRFSRTFALGWLIVLSTVFYAWWRPLNVLIIAPSILFNFALARAIQRAGDERPRAARAFLLIGIAFNIAFLGYFKYKNFFEGAVNDAFGTHLVLTRMILPLGISFITFQKIAFLVDVHAKRIESYSFFEYCLFVMFFPQLIAGPIVHYREVMPQFRAATCRFDKMNVSVGLTLFFLGLYKKVVFADGIAPSVTLIYDRAMAGGTISFIPAWMAAIGYTLQIYFDFSGYTDMAIGAARVFGIRLPANFNSPLRATSIIDFWLRWHITLTRFLTGYLYNPLVLGLTRRRLANGQTIYRGAKTSVGAFISLMMFPTLFTMFISGLWHGAGYLYVIWGVLHGVYLSINHFWRLLRMKIGSSWRVAPRLAEFSGFLLTFTSVVCAMVFFHGPTMGSALAIAKGLVGVNGLALPAGVYNYFAPAGGLLRSVGVGSESWLGGNDLAILAIWIPSLLFFALLCPNTLQFMRDYDPALGVKISATGTIGTGPVMAWQPTIAWGVVIAAIAAIAVLHIGGQSAFIYWQF